MSFYLLVLLYFIVGHAIISIYILLADYKVNNDMICKRYRFIFWFPILTWDAYFDYFIFYSSCHIYTGEILLTFPRSLRRAPFCWLRHVFLLIKISDCRIDYILKPVPPLSPFIFDHGSCRRLYIECIIFHTDFMRLWCRAKLHDIIIIILDISSLSLPAPHTRAASIEYDLHIISRQHK